MKKYSFLIPDELYARLKAEADTHSISMASIARAALGEHLVGREKEHHPSELDSPESAYGPSWFGNTDPIACAPEEPAPIDMSWYGGEDDATGVPIAQGFSYPVGPGEGLLFGAEDLEPEPSAEESIHRSLFERPSVLGDLARSEFFPSTQKNYRQALRDVERVATAKLEDYRTYRDRELKGKPFSLSEVRHWLDGEWA